MDKVGIYKLCAHSVFQRGVSFRFLGYSAISNATTCNANRPWEFTFGSDLSWRDFVNPAGVLFLYFVSAYEIHFLGEHTFTPMNDTEVIMMNYTLT